MEPKAIQDFETVQALLNFSYELTIGNMDAAYQAVRLIKSSNVWENMAHMCVKTKRLDVATVCLGNMGLAKGAQALRESIKEPETDARVAMVAIQLGLHDDAEQLYRHCGRFDLLNTFYQASDRWQDALDIATQHDRIHLRATHFAYAKHLESMHDYLGAIRHYEASDTHRFEVPRMLFDAQKTADLEIYVNQKQDKALFKWWAQYCESNGSYIKALQFYERAQDYLALVRCHCYRGDLPAAQSIVQTTQNQAGAYHLARQLEDRGQIAEAIEFFSLGAFVGCLNADIDLQPCSDFTYAEYVTAGQFNHAVRLAKENSMDSVLMALALQSSPRAMLDIAQYYEQRAVSSAAVNAGQLQRAPEAVKVFIRNAILLYHKGGKVPRALDLCFRSHLHESLRNIADDLSVDTDPELLVQVASFFMQHGQFQKAAQLQITAGRIRDALQLCMEHNVDISDEMAEQMTLPKSKDAAQNAVRIECLLKLALCCESRGNYQLAAKKYTQAGEKVKAMQVSIIATQS
jgi:intraflagellar transport protein 140